MGHFIHVCLFGVWFVPAAYIQAELLRSFVHALFPADGTVESDKGLAMEGFPYVKFRKAASDKPRHPTVGKYEAVVEHKELSRDGVTKQLKLLGMQSSITSQYAPTYDYMQENEYTSVGYYYVPPAVSPCAPPMH